MNLIPSSILSAPRLWFRGNEDVMRVQVALRVDNVRKIFIEAKKQVEYGDERFA